MSAILAIIAQATTSNATDSLSNILTALNLGLAGVGLFAFVKGWIVPGKTYEESVKQREKLETDIEVMRANMTDQILPELQRSRTVQHNLGQLFDRVMDWVEREEQRPRD